MCVLMLLLKGNCVLVGTPMEAESGVGVSSNMSWMKQPGPVCIRAKFTSAKAGAYSVLKSNKLRLKPATV